MADSPPGEEDSSLLCGQREPENLLGDPAGPLAALAPILPAAVEARSDGAPLAQFNAKVTGVEDEDALVLDPTMQPQVLDDDADLALKHDDAKGDDSANSPDDAVAPPAGAADLAMDGDLREDEGSALLDVELENVDPSSAELTDDIDADRLAGSGSGGGPEDFDPSVWRPVFPASGGGGDARGADEPAAVLEEELPEEAAVELAAHVDYDKVEEMPMSDVSEDDEVAEFVSGIGAEAQNDAPDQELTGEPEETAAGEPEDFQELLEDTIRRILREELAGDMGQRLSQNIQKMIRDQVEEAISKRS